MANRIARDPQYRSIIFGNLIFVALGPGASRAAQLDGDLALAHKFMVRLASCGVQDADSEIAVADSSSGIGVPCSFNKELGGKDKVTIPRLDACYRFNKWHRIDFPAFTIDRRGREVLKLDVDPGNETYSVGETLVSQIKYDMLKVACPYSLFHSDRVELGAGISRFSTDLAADNTDWKGRIADSYRGLLFYGSYYLQVFAG